MCQNRYMKWQSMLGFGVKELVKRLKYWNNCKEKCYMSMVKREDNFAMNRVINIEEEGRKRKGRPRR